MYLPNLFFLKLFRMFHQLWIRGEVSNDAGGKVRVVSVQLHLISQKSGKGGHHQHKQNLHYVHGTEIEWLTLEMA